MKHIAYRLSAALDRLRWSRIDYRVRNHCVAMGFTREFASIGDPFNLTLIMALHTRHSVPIDVLQAQWPLYSAWWPTQVPAGGYDNLPENWMEREGSFEYWLHSRLGYACYA